MTLPVVLLSLVNLPTIKEKYINGVVKTWAKSLIGLAGGSVTVNGLDKIPQTGRLCYIANHQGSFDIPLILGYLPGPIGFIAKRELRQLPIVNIWMKAIGCIFIDRADRRAAVEVIGRGVEQIEKEQPLILFPEGTRSRGPQLGTFKHGSLKLPIRSGATIIPLSIAGSYMLKEKTGKISPGKVTLTIHDPINATDYSEDETRKLGRELTEIIRNPPGIDG